METTRTTGLGMIVLAFIIAIIILVFPAFIYIYAWLAVIFMFLGGLVTVLTGG
jgi:hypothetical protein